MAKDKRKEKEKEKHQHPVRQGEKYLCPRCRAEVPVKQACPRCKLEIDWTKI